MTQKSEVLKSVFITNDTELKWFIRKNVAVCCFKSPTDKCYSAMRVRLKSVPTGQLPEAPNDKGR